jgi:hypothetical protein
MSHPSTPHRGPGMGLSPRGSFVNVAEAAEPGSPLIRDEKARSRAEMEIRESFLKQEKAEKAEESKKVEITPAGSPGMFNS